MLVIIDGYNFIFGVPSLEAVLDRGKMEQAREALLNLLARYKATRGEDFTVVFDGRALEGDVSPQQKVFQEIKVVFSRGTTADEDIKALIQDSPHPKDIMVVTSDRGILGFARGYGCQTAQPRDFYKNITQTFKKGKVSTKEPLGKYQGLEQGEVDYWLRFFKTRWEKG